MKNKNEKKTIQKSLKLSSQQLQQIEEQANKKNMKFRDRKSTRLNSSHKHRSRMPSSA